MVRPPDTSPLKLTRRPDSRRGGVGKTLAQHFLVDAGVLGMVVEVISAEHSDTVVEVGPGRGVLTRELVRRAGRVIAVELDSHLAESLAERLGGPDNLTVLCGDARHVDLSNLVDEGQAYKMVGNLPYYAANPIIRRFLEAGHPPSRMVVMLQKEVAQSMVAADGRMGLLAVAVHFYGVPSLVCDVPASAFRPPPKVTSAVVSIDVRAKPAVRVDDVGAFFDTVRAGFASPRKQLRNSLATGLGIPAAEAAEVLQVAAVDPRNRPEVLDLDGWRRVHVALRGR